MKQRKTNLELMRLIAMGMILAHHFSVHGGFYFRGGITGNMLFLQLLSIGGKIGVNLFVMLGSWFLIEEASVRREKICKLWGQIFFYSVSIYTIACVTGLAEFTLPDTVKALFPVLSEQWWFASSYVFLYLLTPVLNRFLTRLDKKAYVRLLAAVSVLWFVVPVLTWLPSRVRDLCWFVYLYAFTGYLRLHGVFPKWLSRRCFAVGMGLLLAAFGIALAGLSFRAHSGRVYETVYFDAHHILIFLSGTAVFLGFERLSLPDSRIIRELAALSFGVYLIHDSNYLRYPLWQTLLRCGEFAREVWLIPYALFCLAAVYLVCGAAEALRRRALVGIGNKISLYRSK